MRVLLIGGGAREHAIGEALVRAGAELFVVAHNENPGLAEIAKGFLDEDEKNVAPIVAWAAGQRIGMAVIGLEDPLKVGLPDDLAEAGIPTVGPTMAAARLETSKLFARELMRRHGIGGQVDYHYFTDADELRGFLATTDRRFALKPVGLTAGKGVRVMGIQLHSAEEAIEYGEKVIKERIGDAAGVVVEEAIEGEEFTLQAFVDGEAVIPMPLVRDYKRAYEGDLGPNTGSMGSYSQVDGLLPFVTGRERDEALAILRGVVAALRDEGTVYRGILYGQFMMTQAGVKVIEFNARFGDPEALNVLPLLENNFLEVCEGIISGGLSQYEMRFSPKATVCKYITPPNYPDNPEIVPIRLDRAGIEAEGVKLYFAKVQEKGEQLLTTPSRFAALVGVADSIPEAEEAVERALKHVEGRYHVRHDIGTAALLGARPSTGAVSVN
ncbi:MAG: phosphoribosylamine--glycine ligase [Dehalococcoidia bacterium]